MLTEPDDAHFILSKTHGLHGFIGASSLERLPVETAIVKAMGKFRAFQLNH
jgi:predicted TIM-barrel enzyme